MKKEKVRSLTEGRRDAGKTWLGPVHVHQILWALVLVLHFDTLNGMSDIPSVGILNGVTAGHGSGTST